MEIMWMTYHRILLADINNVPEVDEHASTDREEGEKANHLASKGAGKENASKAHPSPPFAGELAAIEVRQMSRNDWRGTDVQVSNLPEPNIGVHRQSHEEHKGGVEEDQSCLANVTIVYKYPQITAQYHRFKTMVLTKSDQKGAE
jgi:hypothetical protein